MKNICDWNNCFEIGEYKAPIEKDNSKNYRLLCLNHVKEFNKNWNYFSDMNEQQVINFLKSDLTWHKPTQGFSSTDNFFKILWNNALKDDLKSKYFEASNNYKTKLKFDNNDIKECLELANKVAGLSTTKLGAGDSMPFLKDLN